MRRYISRIWKDATTFAEVVMAVILIIVCLIFPESFKTVKVTKQDLANDYGVTKKTLQKWVKNFTSINYEYYLKKRKLNLLEYWDIKDELGDIDDYPTMTKNDILEKCETYYHTVRNNIKLNIEKLEISCEAYKNTDLFPPRIAQKIVVMLG